MTEAATGGAYHLRAFRMDDFVPDYRRGGKVLLLGCGDGGERPHLERRVLTSVGMDVRSMDFADVVADAHALPFDGGAFDGVLSTQVLEHLRAPCRWGSHAGSPETIPARP